MSGLKVLSYDDGDPVMFIFGHGGLTLLGMASVRHLSRQSNLWENPKEIFAVLFFALLPDLLDKPFTIWILPDTTSTRWIGHTLIFWVFLWLFLRIMGSRWALYSFACLFHLILDRMWLCPRTLLFPLLGWEMDPGLFKGESFWEFLMNNLENYGSDWIHLTLELMGLVILVYAGFRVISRGRQRSLGPTESRQP
jgi:hypothetical protein